MRLICVATIHLLLGAANVVIIIGARVGVRVVATAAATKLS